MDNKALQKIGYGLYILTARDGEKDNGCIINTLMQVTSNPATVVIGVNKQNFTRDMIAKTGHFNVSMLTTAVPFEVFRHFGFQSGREVDKFAGCEDASRAANGILYIPKYTNAYISGKVTAATEFSTHTLFAAEVTDAVVLSDGESISYSYYFANVKPKPKPLTRTGWRCNICGYVYEGEALPPDFVCPICKHGAADFSRIEIE